VSFKIKLLLSFILYGFILVFFTQLVVFKLQEKDIKANSIRKASQTFDERNNTFKKYVEDTNLRLLSVKNSKVFNDFLSNKQNSDLVNSLFLDIANTSNNIMQLRYIDNNGMERIRVNRNSYSSEVSIVKKENLQDKSHRYYFQNTINSGKNVFWYSKLDLNIEHNKIVMPIKPVLRVGVVVFNKGKQDGILIINIFMKQFLRNLTSIPLYNIYLFDKDGNILVDSVHKNCWSNYLKNNKTISTHFPDEYLNILSNDEYFGNKIYSNRIFLNNDEDIHMVIEPKEDYIKAEIVDNLYEFGWIMMGVVLFSFPFSYFFSNIPAKLKEQVDKQKAEQDILLSLFDLSDAVLIKWNNDENWSINFVSKSAQKLLGYSQATLENNSVKYADCIHNDDLQRVTQEVQDAIENRAYFFEHEPYRIITKDGDIKWVLDSTVVVRDAKDEITHFVGYITDITELKNNEIELKNISRTDQLTKISNRMHTDDILQNQYYRFNRDNELCSIVLIDIDYFKVVNDEYGHLVGDSVLIEFAGLIKSSTRAEDVVGRWGGEEFLIILPHTDITQAMQLAEKLRVLVEKHIFTTIKHKTASFGVATLEKGMTIQTLLNTADNALYQSKNRGRNQVTSIQEIPKV
jgi:diguanylate cyclase (GGDEF)-like protein/PAS domain S-box-containing protein